MRVLITNDDGVHAQGIIQLARRVRQEDCEVFVVAPQVEQSGVSSAITFLRPLFPTALGGLTDSQDDNIPGFSVNGTPVDCVRLAINELCPWRPDLVLSGINDGLNAGTNVNYSGTVGGAMAAASFGIPSLAISLESSGDMDFVRAADIAWNLIHQSREVELPAGSFLNLNIPTAALGGEAPVVVVPSEINPMGYHYDQGFDPKARRYFWATNNPGPQPSPSQTDTQALREGKITVSTLSTNLNCEQSRSLITRVFDQSPV